MDDALLQIFRDESVERIERIAGTLLAVERAGEGDGDEIASLFRDAHSIRGSAGMFGFDAIGDLATAMEEVLVRVREAGRILTADTPGLLAAADAIRAALDGDESGLEPARQALTRSAAPDPAPDAGPPASADRPTDGPQPQAPAPAVPTSMPETSVPAPDVPSPDAASPSRNGTPVAPSGPATSEPSRADRTGTTPVTRTMRVDAGKVDALLAATGEAALHRGRLEHLLRRVALEDEAVRQELEHGETLVGDLQDSVLDLRTLPLRTITGVLPRAVRDIAAATDRDVRLDLEGMDTPLDRSVLDGIAEVLVHLLRNAVSHGVEAPDEREAAGKPRTARILLHAAQHGGEVRVSCTDDGRGVSPALVLRAEAEGVGLADILAEAGTSTGGADSALSGRGVGLDAVKRHVEGLGGRLEASSDPGRGSTISLVLPLTLAVLEVLVVERGGQLFGLNLNSVDEAVLGHDVQELEGRRFVRHGGEPLPLSDLADLIGQEADAPADGAPVLIVRSGDTRAAIICDRLLGDRDAVVKPLGPLLAGLPAYLGGSVMPDGAIALLLDPAHLVRDAGRGRTTARRPATAPVEPPKVLVVDDQLTVRELQRTILASAGYRVRVAQDGHEALATLDREQDIACVITDIDMPGLDGFGVLEGVRGRPALASLPVVVVSSRDDERARQRGADAGADAWVLKGQFDQASLLETVGRLVDRA
ncbi:hybrid sensor histidine kinase/response regulator [Patulibacter americanus]|uniref:hybrid sensor histidine kinase/response regulator n=1 Tax=Patulibacter americanus TaxID=588672 RepID=UPI0003B37567|nr:response regulator [Patulibacter americanus]